MTQRAIRLRPLAVAVAAAGVVLAGCGGQSTSKRPIGGETGPSAPAAAATRPAATSAGATTASGSGEAFAPIVEPFDPGHPATAKPAQADCSAQTSTVGIESCYLRRTESVDADIDAVQRGKFTSSSASARDALNADDRAWLAARGPVCQAVYHSGGSIDRVSVSICLLSESTARLDSVKGVHPLAAELSGTDNPDASQMQFFTVADGSRIGLLHTQGDETGGAVVSWIIVGGYQGFPVDPRNFPFIDGGFIDHGRVTPGTSANHVVKPAQEYELGIDYTRLAADPQVRAGNGRFDYTPGGTPVAAFR